MKRLFFIANLGLAGCDLEVDGFDLPEDELQDGIDSGEIWGWAYEAVNQYLDISYRVEDVEDEEVAL